MSVLCCIHISIILLFSMIYTYLHKTEYSNFYNHLGTKTPYRFIENKNVDFINVENCEALKIFMVVRHGTRLPSKKFIKSMKTTLNEIRNEIIEKNNNNDYWNAFNEWQVTINETEEKILVYEGENEMIELAERMQLRFPNMFPKIYSNSSYRFQFTDTNRTQKSAYYFTVGLFDSLTAKSVWFPKPIYKDPILRFYKLCKRWRKEIKKNPITYREQKLFINGSEVLNLLKVINNKLKFEKPLNFDKIRLMYMACAYETAWNRNNISPWCSIFTNKTIKIMEYVEDLKYYWVDGYAYNLTHKQACPLIQNLVQFFNNEDPNLKATVYFTHSGTVLKLLAHLGLYNDEKLLKHDEFKLNSERLWRVSEINAFGSNVAAVLYRCNHVQKILFLHQEKVVRLPQCSQSDFCDFSDFLDIFKNSIYFCNFNEMCQI